MRNRPLRPVAFAIALGTALVVSACGHHDAPNNSSGHAGSGTMGNGTIGNM